MDEPLAVLDEGLTPPEPGTEGRFRVGARENGGSAKDGRSSRTLQTPRWAADRQTGGRMREVDAQGPICAGRHLARGRKLRQRARRVQRGLEEGETKIAAFVGAPPGRIFHAA